ncbi:MAG: Arm DNA-binding domain-containing protein, partial [Bacteroidota bacterium]
MATAKLMLDTDYTQAGKKEDQSAFPLVVRISHKSKKKYIPTNYHLTLNQWDVSAEKVTKEFTNAGRANARISRMLTIALEICARPKETLKNYTVYELAAIVQENINSELNEVTEK